MYGAPLDISFSIDEIIVNTECAAGINDWTENPTQEGYFITLIGEMEVISSSSNFGLSEVDFTATDDEGYAVPLNGAVDCNYQHETMDGY